MTSLTLPGMEASIPATPENYEWYTPQAYIEAARAVMGSIDLDPASCDEANRIVQAGAYYTREQDGLALPWYGNVWLNPPYKSGLIERFVDRLYYALRNEKIDQACVLTNNATETGWGQQLLSEASSVCFPQGRIKFWGPQERGNSPTQGQMICYFGKREEAFYRHFRPLGMTMELH